MAKTNRSPLDLQKEANKIQKEANKLQKEANAIQRYVGNLNFGMQIATFLLILAGAATAYYTFINQQPDIVQTTASSCPYLLTLPQSFYNFSFVNAGQSIGSIDVSVMNYSISAFLLPLWNNGSLILSGGQTSNFRYELDSFIRPYPKNFSFTTKVVIHNGARGLNCLQQTCSYSLEYNASSKQYSNQYYGNLYNRTSNYHWVTCSN